VGGAGFWGLLGILDDVGSGKPRIAQLSTNETLAEKDYKKNT
jgi:hypothetical protein